MSTKKIQPHIAMAMYEDAYADTLEARRIAFQVDMCYAQFAQEEAERIARETTVCWDEYFNRMMLEEQLTQDSLSDVQLVPELDSEFDSDVQPDSFQELSGAQRTRAYRRKQEVRHKKALCRNAINAMANFSKRLDEDDLNRAYCKRRGGHLVQMPTPLAPVAEKIWAQAARMMLV